MQQVARPSTATTPFAPPPAASRPPLDPAHAPPPPLGPLSPPDPDTKTKEPDLRLELLLLSGKRARVPVDRDDTVRDVLDRVWTDWPHGAPPLALGAPCAQLEVTHSTDEPLPARTHARNAEWCATDPPPASATDLRLCVAPCVACPLLPDAGRSAADTRRGEARHRLHLGRFLEPKATLVGAPSVGPSPWRSAER